jgi:predicted HTH domain antitoxin
MSSTVSIQVSREIIHATRITPQELARELAIHLFQQGKLSFGKAREMADMSVWTFQQLLGSRGIVVHYDIEDYEEDLATLRELGRL